MNNAIIPNAREFLFWRGVKLFDDCNIPATIQNPIPNVNQQDMENCFDKVRKEIEIKNEQAIQFERKANDWINDVIKAVISNQLGE